ncbi:MAG: N-6 DNA methylase [Deltaproteobacteria bacterium]|nr:N-6 DNA methylase [Deltaproteobacteria bacterium]
MAAGTNDRFSTINIEGAILPPDLLRRIAGNDKELEGLAPGDYALVGEKLNEAISRSWNKVRALWAGFREAMAKVPEGNEGAKVTQEKWLLPLFKELDYGLLAPAKPVVIEEKVYAISHGWEHTPIHLPGFRCDLDVRHQAGPDHPKMTPHGLVQEFLNRSKGHLWAFVSNGLKLRILRDSVALTRQSFVEFDLEAMLRDEVYPDFVLFWMLCHATRVRSERPEDCYLEKWSKAAQAQGTRALDQLRDGVEKAILTLGRGFIAHPSNKELKAALKGTGLSKDDYYRQLLRLVYRLIFLFVAEDREILLAPDAPADSKTRYRRFYSAQRLRSLAKTVRGTPHGDLWQSLWVVMEKLGRDEGCPDLGLPALGSFLWSENAVAALKSCSIANRDLLDAIRALTVTEGNGVRRYVDYRNLGAEELGGIYESLLELRPKQVNVEEALFELVSASGNERKTTGSYYTPTSLVTCLLDSALDPVLDEAAKNSDPEKAILALKVVDPACGSGHFLIAAAHRIAKRLAFIRTGNEEPSPVDVRRALRDVIGHCIYGVDMNEMAVELCKVSLWMEALEPGRPLSFLDSKIRQGNALIGATPALIAKGIPDEAFEAIEGDDRKIVSSLKRDNRAQRTGQGSLFGGARVVASTEGLTNAAVALEALVDETIEGVHKKERAWEGLRQSETFRHANFIADAWCAAFAWRKTDAAFAITEDLFRRLAADASNATPKLTTEVQRLADSFAFFHWHLAFPEVFAGDPNGEVAAPGWKGGFDVVLGNPPWERVKLQEKEWFAVRRPDIAAAGKAATRKQMIAKLETEDPVLFASFLDARRQAEAESHFIRSSGRYPLCGQGDVNTYTAFSEWNRALIARTGRVGCIVPAGIATDDTTKEFFQDLVDGRALVSLLSFENEEFLFPAVHHALKFSLLTVASRERGPTAPLFVFFARQVEQVSDPKRRFTLTADEIRLLNPNTRTCPIFRTTSDAALAKKIYGRLPVLVREEEPKANPWQVKFSAMFHMANDSGLFREQAQLEKEGWRRTGNTFAKGKDRYLPLYEAKMVHHFDHRYGTYEGQTEAQANQGILPRPTAEQKADPDFVAQPWFWVPAAEVADAMADGWNRDWLLGWRDITRNTDERTVIAAFIPRVGVGDKYLLCLSNEEPALVSCLGTMMASLVFDYAARQKVGGTSLKYFTMRQLPVVAPDRFREVIPYLDSNRPAYKWFSERVLELVYVSNDMTPFARDCGYQGKPFKWDEARRVRIRAELDAAFFHLYGLDRSEVEFVLDPPPPAETFRVLKENETKRYGEYRTKKLVLEQYDAMAASGGGLISA